MGSDHMKRLSASKFLCLFLFLCSSVALFNVQAAEAPKIVTTTIETGLNSNARSAGSGNNEVVFSQDWYLGLALPESFDIELYAGGTKQIEGTTTDGSMNDSYAQLQKNLYKSDFFKFNLSGRYIIPFSERSTHDTYMNWGMQIRPTLIFNFYKGDFFSFSYRLRPTYNEFYYSQDYERTGAYNIHRTFVLANRFTIGLGQSFLLNFYAHYTTKWNTNGDHVDDTWYVSQVLTWTINSTYYIDLYHESSNRFFDSNGNARSLDTFDNKISSYKFVLGVTF